MIKSPSAVGPGAFSGDNMRQATAEPLGTRRSSGLRPQPAARQGSTGVSVGLSQSKHSPVLGHERGHAGNNLAVTSAPSVCQPNARGLMNRDYLPKSTGAKVGCGLGQI